MLPRPVGFFIALNTVIRQVCLKGPLHHDWHVSVLLRHLPGPSGDNWSVPIKAQLFSWGL